MSAQLQNRERGFDRREFLAGLGGLVLVASACRSCLSAWMSCLVLVASSWMSCVVMTASSRTSCFVARVSVTAAASASAWASACSCGTPTSRSRRAYVSVSNATATTARAYREHPSRERPASGACEPYYARRPGRGRPMRYFCTDSMAAMPCSAACARA